MAGRAVSSFLRKRVNFANRPIHNRRVSNADDNDEVLNLFCSFASKFIIALLFTSLLASKLIATPLHLRFWYQ